MQCTGYRKTQNVSLSTDIVYIAPCLTLNSSQHTKWLFHYLYLFRSANLVAFGRPVGSFRCLCVETQPVQTVQRFWVYIPAGYNNLWKRMSRQYELGQLVLTYTHRQQLCVRTGTIRKIIMADSSMCWRISAVEWQAEGNGRDKNRAEERDREDPHKRLLAEFEHFHG